MKYFFLNNRKLNLKVSGCDMKIHGASGSVKRQAIIAVCAILMRINSYPDINATYGSGGGYNQTSDETPVKKRLPQNTPVATPFPIPTNAAVSGSESPSLYAHDQLAR